MRGITALILPAGILPIEKLGWRKIAAGCGTAIPANPKMLLAKPAILT
jgi:hypothetical protein